MAEMNGLGVETNEEMIFPLPLREEDLAGLDEEQLTLEATNDAIRRLYPEINIIPNIPNISGALIPIIPGITLYSYLRFFNAFPTVPAVDIYVNGRRVAENLRYRFFTEYMKAFPGYYRIEVYEAGSRENPLLVTFINLIGYRIYTATVIGAGDNASLELINDSIRPLPRRSTLLRIVQLSPNAPMMDAYLDDSLILADIEYKEVSRYLTTTPGDHNLKFRDTITGGVLVEEPELQLEGGSAYTVYVIGDMNDRVGLQILLEKEGISNLYF